MGAPWHLHRERFAASGVVVRSSNYTLYGDMSSRVMNVLRRFTDDLEIYSIDEAFLGMDGFGARLEARARALRAAVLRWTGIPVSIGTRQLCATRPGALRRLMFAGAEAAAVRQLTADVRAGNRVELVAENPPGGQPLDIMPIERNETGVGELRRGAQLAGAERGGRASDAGEVGFDRIKTFGQRQRSREARALHAEAGLGGNPARILELMADEAVSAGWERLNRRHGRGLC